MTAPAITGQYTVLDEALVQQWEKLHAAHAAAHDAYFRIHQNLSKRIRDAGRGVRCATPITEDLDAHMVASNELQRAQLALHEFCKEHAAYC